MENRFNALNCNDNDVLCLSQHTFKLGDFRKRLQQKFSQIVDSYSLQGLRCISIGESSLKTSDIKWQSTIIDCEILRLGSKNWQKGKLKIQVRLEFAADDHKGQQTIEIPHVYLEFCPDEPEVNQPESPLDDLRQMINQENQQ
jgi:hypothetical protein